MWRSGCLIVAILAVVYGCTGAGGTQSSASTESIGIAMASIPPGSFEMGADSTPVPKELTDGPFGVIYARPTSDGDYDEVPAHRVTITKPFSIGVTEVTIEQFKLFRPDYAVSSYGAPYAAGVSWDDAMAFCQWLSKKEGKPYRLPTEAEWEYVCRAGTTTLFSSGATAPEPETANAWGVKNMHTNLPEWVYDWHGVYPSEPQTDPVGPGSGTARVLRGGGLDYRGRNEHPGKHYPAEMPYYARSANRASAAENFASKDGNIGFRVVQAPLPKTAPLPAQKPFFQTAIKQNKPDLTRGPDMSKPYFHVRPMFPNLGEQNMRQVGWKIGLSPALGAAYHNSAVQVLDNGDIVAAYYNTLRYEDDPDQTVLSMRLRYGAEDWDMPDAWPDFADAADAAPIFWNDHGKLWLFFGSPRLLGGPPFQFVTSTDNGANWTSAQAPNLIGEVGKYTAQPVSSIARDRDGTIYVPIDGQGPTTALFATKDGGKTWYDTIGRTGGRHTALVVAKDGAIMGFGGKDSSIEGMMPLSITRDGGKTYEKTATVFSPLGGGQRPSVVRLASGRLFFVADNSPSRRVPRQYGAIVAISDDDGKTWTKRDLPESINTVGYTTATQTPNGMINIVTSKTTTPSHIELNEQWVLQGGSENGDATSVSKVSTEHENAANGKPLAEWSGGIASDGNYRLNGKQTFFYPNGKKQWEATFAAGKRVGTETLWAADGHKTSERGYNADGTWTWRLFDSAGGITAESKWKGKNLVDAQITAKK